MFPRRTRATPDDALAYVGEPDMFAEADEVHVSVTFTWDIPEAERLEKAWRWIAPTKMGGPAMGDRGGEFVPGMYLRRGYTITSRGCPNNCWFCSVPKREGVLRTLAIRDGWNVLDDNLLACPVEHVDAVFDMLGRQKRRAEFTGGLEAAILTPHHADLLRKLNPAQFFFAYDTPDDYVHLRAADTLLTEYGFPRSSHKRRCYVLIGYPRDTFGAAECHGFITSASANSRATRRYPLPKEE